MMLLLDAFLASGMLSLCPRPGDHRIVDDGGLDGLAQGDLETFADMYLVLVRIANELTTRCQHS